MLTKDEFDRIKAYPTHAAYATDHAPLVRHEQVVETGPNGERITTNRVIGTPPATLAAKLDALLGADAGKHTAEAKAAALAHFADSPNTTVLQCCEMAARVLADEASKKGK